MVTIAACGGSSTASSSGSTSRPTTATPTPSHAVSGSAVDPCALVTAADLRALAGSDPGQPKASTAPVPGGATAKVCTWTTASWGFVVEVQPGDRSSFDAAGSAAPSPGKVVPIPNLGDAVFEIQSPSLVTLAFLKGAVLVVLLYTRFSPDPSQIGAKLAQLGLTVAGRLSV